MRSFSLTLGWPCRGTQTLGISGQIYISANAYVEVSVGAVGLVMSATTNMLMSFGGSPRTITSAFGLHASFIVAPAISLLEGLIGAGVGSGQRPARECSACSSMGCPASVDERQRLPPTLLAVIDLSTVASAATHILIDIRSATDYTVALKATLTLNPANFVRELRLGVDPRSLDLQELPG